MNTIAFALQKGGVGKTSLAGNTAVLAAESRRVLLVDGDPQGSLSSWLCTDPPEHELADVLQGKVALADAIVSLTDTLGLLATFGVGSWC